MPYTHLELESHDWPFPNRYFDPAKASALYKTYVESMIHAEGCGFDWVGCNEHHFSPYGMMANCNLIGGALAYPTKRVKIAMIGNLVPLNNPIRIAEEYAMLDCMSGDRKSTRLNSSHITSSYAVFCLKKQRPTIRCGLPASVRALSQFSRASPRRRHRHPRSR